jgi:hypothetical protein
MACHKVRNSKKKIKKIKTNKNKKPELYPNPFNIVEHLHINS